QLIYGKTTAYGQSSDLDKTMVLSHVVNLTNLQPGTTYHFRTRSVDSAGNVGSMHDLTFTTLPGETSGSQAP
ncbi:MAG TPA: fibronectin type III domain-containing protein, partial [Candidatus Limnocylindrales bacterium]|nr:fibronectin type III domain-containing protein [Candidatus Limnocylindrales bacterium]